MRWSHPLSDHLPGENTGQGLPYLGFPDGAVNLFGCTYSAISHHHPPGTHFTDPLEKPCTREYSFRWFSQYSIATWIQVQPRLITSSLFLDFGSCVLLGKPYSLFLAQFFISFKDVRGKTRKTSKELIKALKDYFLKTQGNK